MLTITENAVTEIRNLTQLPEAPKDAGLRIATDPEAGALTLSLAPAPEAEDTVLDNEGARLFLDTAANTMLEDQTLDAVKDPSGQVQFALAEQPS